MCEELEKCICGANARIIDRSYSAGSQSGAWHYHELFDVGCSNEECEYSEGNDWWEDSEQDAIDKWNELMHNNCVQPAPNRVV